MKNQSGRLLGGRGGDGQVSSALVEQPCKCKQNLQQNELGCLLTNLQLWSLRTNCGTSVAEMPTSAGSRTKCVADRSPVSLQILQRQGGAGQDSHIQLTEWMF